MSFYDPTPQKEPILGWNSIFSIEKMKISAIYAMGMVHLWLSTYIFVCDIVYFQEKWFISKIIDENGQNGHFLMKNHRFSLWENKKKSKKFWKHDKNLQWDILRRNHNNTTWIWTFTDLQ